MMAKGASADGQSSALMTLLRAIASRDQQKVARLLDASPGLAQQIAEVGATRQVSTAYYFDEIAHYVYAPSSMRDGEGFRGRIQPVTIGMQECEGP
ncbi:MAG TPA: hypothetical protein VGV87_24095 [Blastocatellia bacterium]|jgi:hypothetical protein|nr:hypothetical protein [Blastocatellia bacterium]